MAIPLPEGQGWTVPQQALAVFIEASWDELNRPYQLTAELADDEGRPAYFLPGPDRGGPVARFEHPVMVPPVPTAPKGTPGLTSAIFDMPLGTLWIAGPRRRCVWTVTLGDTVDEIGFWVQPRLQNPVIGAPHVPMPSA
jgi:hypothetical protein